MLLIHPVYIPAPLPSIQTRDYKCPPRTILFIPPTRPSPSPLASPGPPPSFPHSPLLSQPTQSPPRTAAALPRGPLPHGAHPRPPTPARLTCSLPSGPAGPLRSSSRCLPGGARRRGGKGCGWGNSAARGAASSRPAGGGCGRSRQRLRFISASGPRGRQHRDCAGLPRPRAAALPRQARSTATMARRALEATRTRPAASPRFLWAQAPRPSRRASRRQHSHRRALHARHTLGRPPARRRCGLRSQPPARQPAGPPRPSRARARKHGQPACRPRRRARAGERSRRPARGRAARAEAEGGGAPPGASAAAAGSPLILIPFIPLVKCLRNRALSRLGSLKMTSNGRGETNALCTLRCSPASHLAPHRQVGSSS